MVKIKAKQYVVQKLTAGQIYKLLKSYPVTTDKGNRLHEKHEELDKQIEALRKKSGIIKLENIQTKIWGQQYKIRQQAKDKLRQLRNQLIYDGLTPELVSQIRKLIGE